MRRRSFIRKSLAGSLGMALTGLSTSAVNNQAIDLTILHTNDMHSRIDPFPQDGGPFAGLGGVTRRASLIKHIREEVDQVLLLDAGDIFQGTPYFNLFGGELEFKLMSQMKYDGSTLGNHDFDNGLDGLEKQLPHANFPFIISNYDFTNTVLNNRFTPYQIFEKGLLKVGVFGLGIELQGLVADKLFAATKYLDPVPVAREMVKQLQVLECDLIVCLSHLGYKYDSDKVSDIKLAQSVSGIDLIIGGHTHTFMQKPELVEGPGGHATLINQVGFGGINLGRIDFKRGTNSGDLIHSSETVKVAN
jgi:5'-nucleotidase